MKGLFVIAPLIIVVILGMALKQRRFLDDNDRARLTKLLYWVVLPALLFRTTFISGTEVGHHRNLFLAAYAAMIVLPMMALFISYFFTHKGNRKLQAFATMTSARANNVYLGLPVAILALGTPGMENASIYLAICLPGYNLISILWGEMVLSGGLSLRVLPSQIFKILKNPLVIASLVGLLFAQLRIPVPETILISMKLVADMATGIALICLGMSLELPNIPSAILRTWSDVIIKLVLHPAVVWGFLTLWPVPKEMFQTAVIISSMPTAVNSFIIAGGMGMDEQYACETVAITTVLAPISIPIWMALLGVS